MGAEREVAYLRHRSLVRPPPVPKRFRLRKSNGVDPQRQRDDGGGSRRPVAERTVRPDVVVFLPPTLREDLRLRQGVEELAIEELVAELAVEGLDVPVPAETPGSDEEGPDPRRAPRSSDLVAMSSCRSQDPGRSSSPVPEISGTATSLGVSES